MFDANKPNGLIGPANSPHIALYYKFGIGRSDNIRKKSEEK